MAKAKFQGYAIGKGFSNIDPGYSALTRLQEKQNQDLANLKQAEKDRRDRDLQAEADLERVMKNEEANRKEIYIEDKVFSTRERALQVNKEIFVQNERAKIKSIDDKQKAFEQIIGFSKQAFEDYKTVKAKDWEATMNASYNYHMTHAISLEDQLKIDLMEDELFKRGANFEAIADRMREEGYTNEEIHYVRGKNSASDYGRLKAYSVQAGMRWQEFAQSELARMGITDKVEQEAALDALRIKYLKAHKLYGVSSDFLEPMFQRMRAGTSQLLAKTQLRNDVEFTKRRTLESLEQLSSFKSPDSLNNYFLAKTREIDPRTKTFFTPSDAKQAVFDTLANIDMFTDGEVKKLLEGTTLLHMNKTWAAANPIEYKELIKTRSVNKTARDNTAATILKQQKKEILDNTRNFFNDPTRWNGDRRVGLQIFAELKKQGFTTAELSEFLPYLDQSVQGRADGDEWRQQIIDLKEEGTLTSEDLSHAWVPQDLKNRYMKDALENDALFGLIDFKEIREDLGGYLRASLGEFSLTAKLHPSYDKALRKAELLFRAEFKRNGGDKAAALQSIEMQIISGRVKSEAGGKGEGIFRVFDPGKQTRGNNQSFFATFEPGTHWDAPKVLDSSTATGVQDRIAQLTKNPNAIDEELLMHPTELEEIADAIKEGRSYKLPEIFFALADASEKHFGTAQQIWERQLKVAIKQGFITREGDLKIEDFRLTLFRDVKDPTAQKLINNIRTKADLLKEIQKHYNPASARDPRFMSSTVVRKLKSQVTSVFENQLTREEMRDNPDYEYDVDSGTYSEYGVE